jgi:uncharacterized protein (DUF1015 family)
MASIFPFAALRYDPERVPLSQVVTQPYDKITPEMQERYYAGSPYNVVRLILRKKDAGDPYEGAAISLAGWRREGVLEADSAPAIYPYWQTFRVPGSESTLERRGFIAAGQLEDYAAGVVFRHEQTLSGPKLDRLNLLRATRAHFGQIFMLYSDPGAAVEAQAAPEGPPIIDVADEYGVRHRVWKIANAARIEAVRRGMADKKLIIADGHHRYETALAYRNERRRAAGKTADASAPFERAMMTFVNMESPGLLVLPTHRVVHGVGRFEEGALAEACRSFFAVRDVGARFDPRDPTALLPAARPGETAMLAVTRRHVFLLRAEAGTEHPALAGMSRRQAELDVVRLHKVVLESVLGLSEQSIREQRNILYLRDAREAVERVRGGGADAAFLINPVSMRQVRDLAFAGEVLPQKSTDFYPKLLSGLTIYALE